MSEPSLPEKILALHGRLSEERLPHAFGGALALAYYAEPRSTDDVDVNLFVGPDAFVEVARALQPLGVDASADLQAVERDGQCRLAWGRTPLDLFFAYDAIHEAMRREARLVPFGDERLPILSPEHLLVCKVAFDRPKDWLDAEQMLIAAPELDVAATRGWLERILDETDPRMARFQEIVEQTTAA